MTGVEFKNIRRVLKLTQVALAEKLGKSPMQIKRYESEKTEISRELAFMLTTLANINFDLE